MNKLIAELDRQFSQLHQESRELIHAISPELLYSRPPSRSNSSPAQSGGEQILRSAAAVEQTFGGLTSNLWDDPFEWSLPEYLSTPAKVIEHLVEVVTTRKRALSSFDDDACLFKHFASPSGETRPLLELLLGTLVRSAQY